MPGHARKVLSQLDSADLRLLHYFEVEKHVWEGKSPTSTRSLIWSFHRTSNITQCNGISRMHLFSQTLTLALQSLNGSSSGKTAIGSQTFIQTINLKKINGSPSMECTEKLQSVRMIAIFQCIRFTAFTDSLGKCSYLNWFSSFQCKIVIIQNAFAHSEVNNI